jgi:predicted nucleic acid-binding protein
VSDLKRVCIDASLAFAWLTYGKYTASANALRLEWLKDGVELLGPSVFHADVISVLLHQVLLKKMLAEEAEEAFSICIDMPLRIVAGPDVNRSSWRLATEIGLTGYDAQYLAVAELEDCPLWTADRMLANLASGKAGRVKWLGDYGQKATVAPPSLKRDITPALDDPGLWRKF